MLVNPPRRGLGSELTAQLEALAPKYILYSSCNPQTMVKDIAELSSYQMIRVQWFDMFPHTDHAEVLTLLVRK